MEMLIHLIPLALMILFVFAILLLIIAMLRYVSYLLVQNSKIESKLGRTVHGFWYFFHADVSGRLSYLKVFFASVIISALILFVVFLSG
jgi:hypothetical protein